MATMLSAATSDNRLADAVMQGDRSTALSLLKQKVDVNVPMGDGTTALHWAADRGDLEIARMLIDAGANVKAESRIGAITPLFLACKNGNPSMIDLLLKAGADAKSANALGTTPLMLAAASGSAEAVEILLNGGSDVNVRERTNGQTALMFAAALNRGAAIKVLLQHGADPAITTKVASFDKVYEDANGDRIPEGTPQYAEAAKKEAGNETVMGAKVMGGMTALLFAAREGQMEAARALLDGGADVNQVSFAEKTSPLTEAIINGHFDFAKFLLDDHAANPNLANIDGLRPLYAAVDMQNAPLTWYPQPSVEQEKVSYLDLIKDLAAHGADLNARIARKLWFRKIWGADDWINPNGATAFWRAAYANDVAAMKLLVALGADPKIPTVHGCTPLIVAAGYGFEYQISTVVPDSRLAAVKFLVGELNADVNAKDDQGFTALHGAAYIGDNELVQYLADKGADVTVRASKRFVGPRGVLEPAPQGKGDSAADMANGPQEKSVVHADTIALLRKLGSPFSNACRSTGCVINTRPDKPPK